MRRLTLSWIAIFLILALACVNEAQRGLYFLRQNDPPNTELIVARWKFSTNGRIGHMGWSHNYPDAEIHLNQLVSEATDVHVEPDSYRIVELGSPEVFKYPFAYVSEPGEMDLSEMELSNLRQFIDRGGFVIVDDFDGPWQMDQFRRQLYRAFPQRELFRLGPDHEIFHTFFDVTELDVWAPYVPGGEPMFFGFNNSRGDLALIACFNNDFANFWDWIDERIYPLRPSSDAFRMGINFVIYAMTH